MNSIRFILVATSHPGNIGAAARAMKTMGFSQLVLVAPDHFPDPHATAMASGAEDVLQEAKVVSTLTEALSDCHQVIGVSARDRSLPMPVCTPRYCAEQLAGQAHEKLGGLQTALVFGRERTGLTNEELDSCQQLLHIPANPGYRSLNLAAAVQVVAYELYQAFSVLPKRSGTVQTDVNDLAQPGCRSTADQKEHFYSHLEEVLRQIGHLDPDQPRHMMRRLRRLFNRADLDSVELQLLRGILSAVQGQKSRPRR